MITARDPSQNSTLTSLEAAVVSARSGFACMFSTSEEYERALISERRAQGRYGAPPPRRWPMLAFVGCAVTIAGVVLLLA
ncbi:hypothetical protein ONR75_16160 [Rhodopseudomonas sp. P2A-2r]|uniref:hypothetical protein n=1 Tax=Rhodopseudomonas sp. P2A-2r TaxID=2991972 RepID=UPI002234D8F4|nr:hypothetical protein [Rhodopseudomonas sp. P2A-2r]UZE51963.1 hypothetical protein ONR75_16160 [Rhodopseudomonas sp. P2A-2r]